MLCRYSLDLFLQLGGVLTLFQPKTVQHADSLNKKLESLLLKYDVSIDVKESDGLVKALLDVRKKAREQKNWKTADEIRKELEEVGYEIQDTETGPVWRRK
jgi:cysteinyl-tRNA synthetase